MKKRKIVYSRLCITILLLAIWCIESLPVQAAVAKLTIQASSDDIKVGDSFYLMLTLTADEAMKGFDGYISYDQSYMKFITGGSVSHGNDDEIHINDTKRDQGTTKIKYAIKCQARRAGVCEIAIKKPYKVYRMEDDAPMSVGSSSLNLKISSPEKKKKKNKKKSEQSVSDKSIEENMGEMEELMGEPGETIDESGESKDESGGTIDESGEEDTLTVPGESMGKNESTLQTPPKSDKIGSEPADQEEEPLLGRTLSPESGNQLPVAGLDKKTCIAIICMAVSGIVMILTMLSGIWRKEETENEVPVKSVSISEEELSLGTEHSLGKEAEEVESELSVLARMGQEDTDEIDLEEVQRRLEAKRGWLKGGGKK